MESLLYLLAISGGFTAGAVFWHRKKLSGRVLIFLSVIGPLVVLIGYSAVLIHNRVDTEVWNGEVTNKTSEEVSCEHSYQCNCRQDSNKNTVCDTCYEHPYDIDWKVENTAGDDIKIRRVDSQGLVPPPRWLAIQLGDAVAQTHHFVNYVMGAKDSLFNTSDQQQIFAKYKSLIPEYPDDVYDYYKIRRVLTVGDVFPDALSLNAWDQQLALMLRPLGPRKQVNVIIVLTTIQDPNFANAIRTAWLGGKKNDVVVIVGAAHYPKVDWARVFSWSDNEAFKIQLADAIQDKATLDPVDTTTLIGGWVNRDFSRKHMKDFSYLAWESTPSMSACSIIALLSLATTAGFAFLFFHKPTYRRRQRY